MTNISITTKETGNMQTHSSSVTIDTETVTVPKSVLGPVLTAHLHAYGRDKNALGPEAADAVRTVFNLANTAAVDENAETVRLDAETAWTLAFHCLAEEVYGLDETKDETYRHPAVAAQYALMKLVEDQAPETDARHTAAIEARLANSRRKAEAS